jgi:hypothetical protein
LEYGKCLHKISDGHGVVGHEVSGFLKENLPVTLDNELKKRLKNGNMNKIIEETFVATNYRLCNETGIDTHFRFLELLILVGAHV